MFPTYIIKETVVREYYSRRAYTEMKKIRKLIKINPNKTYFSLLGLHHVDFEDCYLS